MTKKRRMTQREKDDRARVKKQLQAKGLLPPDKPRLDRRKFAAQVMTEFQAMDAGSAAIWLHWCVGLMVSADMRKVTPEEVGVLKLLKLAVETEKFMEPLRAEDRGEYDAQEYMERVVLPIYKL